MIAERLFFRRLTQIAVEATDRAKACLHLAALIVRDIELSGRAF